MFSILKNIELEKYNSTAVQFHAFTMHVQYWQDYKNLLQIIWEMQEYLFFNVAKTFAPKQMLCFFLLSVFPFAVIPLWKPVTMPNFVLIGMHQHGSVSNTNTPTDNFQLVNSIMFLFEGQHYQSELTQPGIDTLMFIHS